MFLHGDFVAFFFFRVVVLIFSIVDGVLILSTGVFVWLILGVRFERKNVDFFRWSIFCCRDERRVGSRWRFSRESFGRFFELNFIEQEIRLKVIEKVFVFVIVENY